ncbi:MAG: HAMP domain-containing protein, partial [Deltaproteobacteria bacterium]|nr:HAMP domain-containing protein [Deltaproteobacteria bacterium]
MRLQPKLTLGILAASAVPLALAGFTSARLSERALRERILGDHEKLAKNAAEGVARFFDGILDSLSVYPQLRDLETASPEVTTGVLRLAYRSHDEIAIVALLSEDGTPVVPPVYLSHQEDARALGRLSIVTEDDRSAFLGRIPKEQAQKSGKGMGQVVMAGSPSEPRCAVAVAFRGSRGRYLLSADVSLQALHRELGEISRGGTEVVLVPTAEGEARLRETREALSVLAPAGQTGLGVVVTQPSHVAFEHVRTLRQRTMYWLGVAILVAAAYGIVLARSMSRRIANLAAGTKALAKGRWESKVTAEGNDEVTALAHAFNHMADELSRATSEIKEQNEEITRWNQELEKRVQAKTRELERAQELLLRSKSLSQIGTMGAGIAHEINNPLTGVLG